jgi:predicted secreted protein
MKRVLVLSLVLIAVACSSTPKHIGIVEREGTSFTLAKGKEFELKLTAQLSTGYKWVIASKPDFITETGVEEVITSGKGIDGGYDVQIIRITASKAGKATLVLHYLQPWKKEENPERVLSLDLTVTE